MTPAARLSAAIDILDQIRAGGPAEQVLTNWARGNRFAGSGDRAAIRDLVFDALRCWRSFVALGGAETGRGMMIGAMRARGVDPSTLFTGARFAPAPLSAANPPRAMIPVRKPARGWIGRTGLFPNSKSLWVRIFQRSAF